MSKNATAAWTCAATILITCCAHAAPFAYVTNQGSNTVSVVDTATNALTSTISVGTGPVGVSVNPAGTRVYIGNSGSNSISVIDTSTNAVIATIPVCTRPDGVVVNPAGTRVYVACQGSANVSIIDATTNAAIGTITVGGTPTGIAINPAGTRLFVVNAQGRLLTVWDTATNASVASVGVGGNPLGVATDPSGSRIYVANYFDNTVTVLDGASYAPVRTITVGATPVDVAVRPDGARAFVTNQSGNSVSIIDTATLANIQTVAVGTQPVGVAFNASGTRAYVANLGSNTVSVLDASSGGVVATVAVGSGPNGFGNFVGPGGGTVTPPPPPPPAPSTTTAAVSAGYAHAVLLKSNGTLDTWGNDGTGQLGLARQTTFTSPARTKGLPAGITAVGAFYQFSVAIAPDATVWIWGQNLNGSSNYGAQAISSSQPQQVSGLTDVAAVGGLGFTTLFLKRDGTVWSLQFAQVTAGDQTTLQASATQVAGLSGIVAIAGGIAFSVALRNDGTVFTWGDNQLGELGDGTNNFRSTPAPVPGLSNVQSIAAGYFHVLAAKGDGTVWTWGLNDVGELGDGGTANRSSPAQIGVSSVASVAAGPSVSYAITTSGTLLAWGGHNHGSLGLGPADRVVRVPEPVSIAPVAAVWPGGDYAIAKTRAGDIYGWGGEGGELCNSTLAIQYSPIQLTALPSVASVSSGVFHSMWLTSAGAVFGCGDDSVGQLGDGAAIDRPLPTAINSLSNIDALSSGPFHVLAVDNGGSIWAWGDNNVAELGVGPASLPVSRPTKITDLANVSLVAAGRTHSLALKTDRTVWGWGGNSNGQLGNGQTSAGTGGAKVQVVGLSNVTAISAGDFHSVALKGDGTVWTWGNIGFGPSPSATSTPVQVQGLPTIVAISAGANFSVAVDSSGAVWGWGQNAHGQLGDQTGSHPSPVKISGIANVAKAAAGDEHVLALTKDGQLWTWGRNTSGSLGNGTTIDSSVPVQLAGMSGFVDVDAGAVASIALRNDGTVWTWGGNYNGQLGDGTFALRLKPVVVRRENGSGTIAGGDWFMNAGGSQAPTVGAADTPTFLAGVDGSTKAAYVSITANVQFRLQDIGKPIHVFVYAPAAIVKRDAGSEGAKTGSPCLLAQVGTDGSLHAADAATVQAYTGGAVQSQTNLINIARNVNSANLSGATFCVGAGATGTESTQPGNSTCVATVPGAVACLPGLGPGGVVPNIPGALSGLWWNSNESGWGIHFTQRSSNTFAAWYTYDASGNPKWYVSTCVMGAQSTGTTGTCSGVLLEVSGPTFFGIPFNSSLVHSAPAGDLQVTFQNQDAASMTYSNVAGQTRTVPIVRQPLATGTSPPQLNYTDLWWAGQTESGWGMAITQQFTTMFLAWYVYDNSAKPTWYVTTCTLSGTTCAGPVLRTTGPAFGPTFNPSQVQSFSVGNVTVNFTDANNATLSYTVNGVSGSKNITRELF